MIVKVCGMRDWQNIEDLVLLKPDMIGFIFYPKSPRFVDSTLPATPDGIGRVGVFVDQSPSRVLEIAKQNALTHIQLHGSESREMCATLRTEGFVLLKAISVAQMSDLDRCSEYDGVVDYMLLDTKTPHYGGSGCRFDWNILCSYCANTPFILSGGIDNTMAEEIRNITHPMFRGVDLNSRFELAPALKNIDDLKIFIPILKQ